MWKSLEFFYFSIKFNTLFIIYLKGINNNHATKLATNINSESKFVEVNTLQQTSNFECGMFVAVNAKQILTHILFEKSNVSLGSFIKLLRNNPFLIDNSECSSNIYKPTEINPNKESFKNMNTSKEEYFNVPRNNRFSVLNYCNEEENEKK